MFLVALVCLSVGYQHYANNYERIAIKSYGGIWGGKRSITIFFLQSGDLDHHADCPIEYPAIYQQIMSGF